MTIGYGHTQNGSERSGASTINNRKSQMVNVETAYREKDDLNVAITVDSGLSTYVDIGLQRNAGLKGAFYQWKSSFSKIAQSFSLPDPQFSYSDYLESVETRVGPQKNAFSIKQKFPMFDKLWIQKSKAFKASEVAYYDFEKKRLELVYQITDTYFEYAYLRKAILLTEANMKLLSNFESVAQKRYASGLQENQDLLKIQVELGKLENELLSLEDLRTSLTARLNALLNLPSTNILPWPEEVLEDVSMHKDYENTKKLIEALKENNPQLRAMNENIEKNKDAVKLAKRQYIPDLTVGFTQIETGSAINPSLTDSGKDAQMVMFSVNVPIWLNRINAGVKDAKASLNAAKHLKEDKENELLSKLALVKYKFHDAYRQSELYKNALIPKAVQTLNATKSGYESGKVDFLSLIDAQRILLNFQMAYYRQVANVHQRSAELSALLGAMDYSKEGEMHNAE